MKVILTEKVPTLGNIGEVVKVSAGHARNFLFPRKLAVMADEGNQRALDGQKKRLAKKIAAEKGVAQELKAKIDGVALEFIKKVGANGKLFGSITNADLAKELSQRGIEVERRNLVVDRPIKQLGNYEVKVKLFTDVEANFKVKVAIDEAQAEELKKMQAEARKNKKAKEEAEAKAKEDAAKELAQQTEENQE